MIRYLEKLISLFYTEDVGMNNHIYGERPVICSTNDDDWNHDYDGGLAVEEEKPKLKPPKQYKVFVVNDDYTPMEFVVQVLIMFFAMDEAKATRVMMSVHTKGKGICGIFSHEIAETKVDQVNEYSRMNQHPLMCIMEEA
jgi:ATP-dependent Clp protease adaptor protein ClpS